MIGHLERLERRTLFAGNVQVFLDNGGNLIVRGDDAVNGIQLDQFGEFVIQGIDAGGAPTRVNGVENGIAAFPVTGGGDIRISLRHGADKLEVGTRSDSVFPPDDLEIDTGGGDDSVLLIGDTDIADDLVIYSGSGKDSVFIVDIQIGDDVSVNTSDGDDTVGIYGSTIGDDLSINTGTGKDTVGIGLFNGPGGLVYGRVTVAHRTDITLGDGNDRLELVDSVFTGAFKADGGKGTDTLVQTLPSVFGHNPTFTRFELV